MKRERKRERKKEAHGHAGASVHAFMRKDARARERKNHWRPYVQAHKSVAPTPDNAAAPRMFGFWT